MFLQDLVAGKHEGVDVAAHLARGGVFGLTRHMGQMLRDGLLQHIVRLGQLHGVQLFGVGNHHANVAEGISHGDGQAGLLQKLRKLGVGDQVVHEGHGFLAVNIAAVVAADDRRAVFILGHGTQVAAEADGAVGQDNVHAGGFQHAAAGVVGLGRVAENAENGGVAAGGHAVGHGERTAEETTCDTVKGVEGQYFHGGVVGQLRQLGIGHAVADHEDVFHIV